MTCKNATIALLATALLISLGAGCSTGRRGRAGIDSGPTRPGPDTGVTTGDSGTGGDGPTTPDTSTGVDTGSTGGTAGDTAVAGYRPVVQASCDAAHRCRDSVGVYLEGATDEQFVGSFGNSAAECLADGYPATGQEALRDGVNSGRILYDASSASICAGEFAGQTCEFFWTGERSFACDNAITGTVPDGASCGIGAECISGSCSGGTCAAAE